MKCNCADNDNADNAKFDSLTAFIDRIVIKGEEARVAIFCLPFSSFTLHPTDLLMVVGVVSWFSILNLVLLSTVLFADHPHVTRNLKLVKGWVTTEKNLFLFSSMNVRQWLVHFVLFPLVFVPSTRTWSSCTDFLWNYCSCSPSSCMHFSSSASQNSVHFDTNFQLSRAGCALRTGLSWFHHIISNKPE